MKTNALYIILIALIALVVCQSLMNRGSFRQAQSLSQSMEAHLDTLRFLTKRYEHIHQNYEALHTQLVQTQHRISTLNRDITRLSNEQLRDVLQIQDSLRQILRDYDTIPLPNSSHFDIPKP